MSRWENVGNDVELTMVSDHLDRFTGMILRHRCANENGQMSTVLFDLPWNNRPENASLKKWRVEQWEPLTVHPSILCRVCGLHGYIREGAWVSDADLERKSAEVLTLPVALTIGGETKTLGTITVTRGDDPDIKNQLTRILKSYSDSINDGSWLNHS